MCKAYHDQFGRAYTTACPSNLYGPHDNYGPSAHVIPGLMMRISECMKTGEPLVVWGDGNAIREFLYVDDAADAIGFVLEKWNKPDAINIGTGEGWSIARLVSELTEITGFNGDVIFDTSQPTGIQHKTFDISKLKSLGWIPKTSLMDGLAKTWEDFNKNPIRSK
jgi:GDP-L-fucose synthase